MGACGFILSCYFPQLIHTNHLSISVHRKLACLYRNLQYIRHQGITIFKNLPLRGAIHWFLHFSIFLSHASVCTMCVCVCVCDAATSYTVYFDNGVVRPCVDHKTELCGSGSLPVINPTVLFFFSFKFLVRENCLRHYTSIRVTQLPG